jgi:hypothetical protein
MNQADIARRLARAWPGIAGVLDSHLSPALRRRPKTYGDRRAFEALLLYVWKGLPVRDSLGGKFPTGGVLHRRWRAWRDAGALKPMVGAYARALPRAELKAWRELLAGYDRQVLCGKDRNPAMAWLMVNRFWHEAVAVPFIEAGKRSGGK